jgi:trimeric autotransporter adhesin
MPRLRLLNAIRSVVLLVLFVQLGGCSICGKFFRDKTDIVGLAISPLNGSVQPSTTQQFMATGTYSDNSTGDVTSQTEWKSSNPAIATITSAGLATGVAYGNTTISGDCQCYVVNTKLTVSSQAATITSIAVTPATATISTGNTQQFVATATYSNGTTNAITSSATWTSSANAIATITSAGLATGVASGNATIAATSGSVSGTATLTVQ